MAIAQGPRQEEKHDREDPKHSLVRLENVVTTVPSGPKCLVVYGIAGARMFEVAATSDVYSGGSPSKSLCRDIL